MSKNWTYHPKPNENGGKHCLAEPSCEVNLAYLADAAVTVTFIPGSTCSDLLNDVVLAPCDESEIEHALWRANEEPISEPPFVLPAGKRAAAGAVVIEPDGRLWLVAPSNGFGGYKATFPKGRAETGATLQATAIKEVWEESGLRVILTAWLGDFSRSQTFTRFYLARRVGGHPSDMGWESQAVHLATMSQARQLLNRETDHAVLDALVQLGEGAR